MTTFTRRNLFAGAAAAPRPTARHRADADDRVRAATPPAGKQAAGWYRYKIGSIEVTVATDGVARFKMAEDHVINIKKDVVNAALAEVFMEKDMMTTPYNPICVNTGSKLAVIDTGTGEANYKKSQRRRRPVHDQSRGRRHRPQRGRYRDHLALPRRPHQRPADGRQFARLIRTPKSWCRRGAQILDGRRRDEPRLQGPHRRQLQERAARVQRRGAQAREDL